MIAVSGVVDGNDQTNIDGSCHSLNQPLPTQLLTPLVQVRDLDGEFDIVYEKPANAQTVTLDLDDTSAGVSLDRTNYSQGTDVVITIDDHSTERGSYRLQIHGGLPPATIRSMYAVLVLLMLILSQLIVADIETQANAQTERDDKQLQKQRKCRLRDGKLLASPREIRGMKI